MLIPLRVRASFSRRPALLAVVAAVSFTAGALTVSLASPRDAQAQGYSSTIQVPRDGLTFRSADGHAIARLSYDSHGGVFQVLDEHGSPVASMGESRTARPNAPVVGPNTAWSLDDIPDPWARVHAPVLPSRPPAGL
jgi:hypothetical protein